MATYYYPNIQLTDQEIVVALLNRNSKITRQYFYIHCYPLFKSIYDNYYTDCDSCLEFINEIYILILTPNLQTGKCKLQNFRYESSLTTWLKSVCLFFCYERFEKKKRRIPNSESKTENHRSSYPENDNATFVSSEIINFDFSQLNRNDIEQLLNSMPNKRYRDLIRLRYLEDYTNEETAHALNLKMSNYYNMHLRAKEQYYQIWRKEEYNG